MHGAVTQKWQVSVGNSGKDKVKCFRVLGSHFEYFFFSFLCFSFFFNIFIYFIFFTNNLNMKKHIFVLNSNPYVLCHFFILSSVQTLWSHRAFSLQFMLHFFYLCPHFFYLFVCLNSAIRPMLFSPQIPHCSSIPLCFIIKTQMDIKATRCNYSNEQIEFKRRLYNILR